MSLLKALAFLAVSGALLESTCGQVNVQIGNWSITGNSADCQATAADLLAPGKGLTVAASILNASFVKGINPSQSDFTILVPGDTAFREASGDRATVAQALLSGLPSDRLINWLLYTSLPTPVPPTVLALRSELVTSLETLSNDPAYGFKVTSTGTSAGHTNVTLTDGLSPGIEVLDSFQVCKAWVYVLDAVPWPTKNTSAAGIPTIPALQNNDSNGLWKTNSQPQSFAVIPPAAWNLLPNISATVPNLLNLPGFGPPSPSPPPPPAPPAPSVVNAVLAPSPNVSMIPPAPAPVDKSPTSKLDAKASPPHTPGISQPITSAEPSQEPSAQISPATSLDKPPSESPLQLPENPGGENKPLSDDGKPAPPPGGTNVGAIVGGVVAGLVVVALVVIAAVMAGKRRKRERRARVQNAEADAQGSGASGAQGQGMHTSGGYAGAWRGVWWPRRGKQYRWEAHSTSGPEGGTYKWETGKYNGEGYWRRPQGTGKVKQVTDLGRLDGQQPVATAPMYDDEPADSASSVGQAEVGSHIFSSARLGRTGQAAPPMGRVNPGFAASGAAAGPGHRVVAINDSAAGRYPRMEASENTLLPAVPEPQQALPLKEWELDPADITITKTADGRDILIGQGGFGSVYLGKLHNSTDVAVKVLKARDARSREAFRNEMDILRALKHPNIVQFLGACMLDNTIALVTEYMREGDLWHALSRDNNRALSFYKRGREIAISIAEGTVYMHNNHNNKIIHLDLKSANILLDDNGRAKIADVGLAKIMSRELTQVSARGSFDWVAPEVLRGDEINDRADIWSLAVVLWEICSGERPRNRYLRELKVPEECPYEVNDLIMRCRREPNERPSAKDVYEILNCSPKTLEEAVTSSRLMAMKDANSLATASHQQAGRLAEDLERAAVMGEPGEDRLGPLPANSRLWERQQRSHNRHAPLTGPTYHSSPHLPSSTGGAQRMQDGRAQHDPSLGINPFKQVAEPEGYTDEVLTSDPVEPLLEGAEDASGPDSGRAAAARRPVGKKPSPFASPRHQEQPLSFGSTSFGGTRR